METAARYLLNQSVHVSLLFVLIAVVCSLLRNKSAHIRYLLWLLVIAKCLIPSLMTISLAILPQSSVEIPAAQETGPIDISTPVITAKAVDVVEIPIETHLSFRDYLAELSFTDWFALAWIVGAVVLLFVVVVRAIRTHTVLSKNRKSLSDTMQNEINGLFKDLRHKPKCYCVDGIAQPFVWGLWTGSIYLPSDFEKKTIPSHRRQVVMHELAHITRCDPVVNLLQTVAQIIFFFHPFVWIANMIIRAEREKCCDEVAIAKLNALPADYGRAIVDTLVNEYNSTIPTPSMAIAGPIKNIESRIKTIMKPNKKFHKRPTAMVLAAVLLLAVIAVPVTVAVTEKQIRVSDNLSEMAYIIPAADSPKHIEEQVSDVFMLSEGHVIGLPRMKSFKDVVFYSMLSGGDIYYYYDDEDEVGKVIFLRQNHWDRKQPVSDIGLPVITLDRLPFETSVSTIDGREYRIRFIDPDKERPLEMMGPLKGKPGDLRRQCLIRYSCVNDAVFALPDNIRSDFDSFQSHILSNRNNRTFEGLFAAMMIDDEITAYCEYTDPYIASAFRNNKLAKILKLKKNADTKWQVKEAKLQAYSGIRSELKMDRAKYSDAKIWERSEEQKKDSDTLNTAMPDVVEEPVGVGGMGEMDGGFGGGMMIQGAASQDNNKETQVSIEARIIVADKSFFEKISSGIPSIASKESRNAGVSILDEKQLKLLLSDSQSEKSIKQLTAPKVLVFNEQPAEIKIASEVNYISGYTENNENPNQPDPIVEMVTEGVKFNVTPHITNNDYIVLKINFSLTYFDQGRPYYYKEKHEYYIPEIGAYEINSNVAVADGQTVWLDGGPVHSKNESDDEEQVMFVLIKPSIVIPPVIEDQ